jgi:hypothetical protein
MAEAILAIAREVDAVDDELGATSAQVALAWLQSGSERIVPVVGARTLEQAADLLGSLDGQVPSEALARLDEVRRIELGFRTISWPTLRGSTCSSATPGNGWCGRRSRAADGSCGRAAVPSVRGVGGRCATRPTGGAGSPPSERNSCRFQHGCFAPVPKRSAHERLHDACHCDTVNM